MRFRPTFALLAILVVVAAGVAVLTVSTGSDHTLTIRSAAATSHAAKLRASRATFARIPDSQRRADAVARSARAQYHSEIGGRMQRAAARGVAHNAALVAALVANRLGVARSIATSLL